MIRNVANLISLLPDMSAIPGPVAKGAAGLPASGGAGTPDFAGLLAAAGLPPGEMMDAAGLPVSVPASVPPSAFAADRNAAEQLAGNAPLARPVPAPQAGVLTPQLAAAALPALPQALPDGRVLPERDAQLPPATLAGPPDAPLEQTIPPHPLLAELPRAPGLAALSSKGALLLDEPEAARIVDVPDAADPAAPALATALLSAPALMGEAPPELHAVQEPMPEAAALPGADGDPGGADWELAGQDEVAILPQSPATAAPAAEIGPGPVIMPPAPVAVPPAEAGASQQGAERISVAGGAPVTRPASFRTPPVAVPANVTTSKAAVAEDPESLALRRAAPPVVAALPAAADQPAMAASALPSAPVPASVSGAAGVMPDPALAAIAAPAPAASPPPTERASEQRGPGSQIESAIAQVGTLREALRSASPAMTVQHAEFGAVSVRLEQAAPDQWRAVLASRDPGFVPAIQAALETRAVAATADTSGNLTHHHGASQNGAGDQRYGASPNGGQGTSQPYLGQSGSRDGEAAPDQRRPTTAATLAGRSADAEEASAASSANRTQGGLFA